MIGAVPIVYNSTSFRTESMILGIILDIEYQINDTGRLCEKEYNKKHKK